MLKASTALEKISLIKFFNGESTQVFYWTHFLYLVFWALVILHAPNFWKWFVGPACLFLIEKSLRFYKSVSCKGKCYVTTGVVLPSRVVNLVIKRPTNFSFKPGDYIYLNIPSIAHFEWHPFTISSAPEQTDTISLHIRAVGHWTNSLYQVRTYCLELTNHTFIK